MDIKLVIYDCDGVIVNSDAAIFRYFSWLCEKVNIEPLDFSDNDFKRKVLALTEDEILRIIAKGDDAVYNSLKKVSDTVPYNDSFDHIYLEDSLIDGLEYLKSKNIICAVDTNRGGSLTYLLKHFNIFEYFSYTVTSRDVEHPKPSPEGVYKICKHFNIHPSEAIFIGDSFTDYEAAKAAGAFFISFKNESFDCPIMYDHKEISKYI